MQLESQNVDDFSYFLWNLFSGKIFFTQCFRDINSLCCGGKNFFLYVVVLFLYSYHYLVFMLQLCLKTPRKPEILLHYGRKWEEECRLWPERLVNQFPFLFFILWKKLSLRAQLQCC